MQAVNNNKPSGAVNPRVGGEPMQDTKRISAYVTAEKHKQYRELCKKKGVSTSAMTNMLIAKFIEEENKK